MGGKILELNEMIDMVEDFVNEPTHRQIYVGGMVGTQLFKFVMEVVLSKNDFKDICVIEGCQDYIGLTKQSAYNNHFFYADFIKETKIPDFGYSTGYDRGFMVWNPVKLEYKHELDVSHMGHFNYVIINDTQLIPVDILTAIKRMYPGKLIMLFDPYEAGSEPFIGYPSVIDTLTKSSAITALARALFNVETPSIDKSVRCSVKEGKVYRRTLGKNDGNQYVTNDKFLANEVWAKQMGAPFKKGLRLMVTDTRVHRFKDIEGKVYTVTKDTMLVVETAHQMSKRAKVKIWNTKCSFETELTYLPDTNIGVINVRPANILMVNDIRHHRFNNIVLAVNGDISTREKYLLLKNTNNLVVGT
jgi:hypothetical protein